MDTSDTVWGDLCGSTKAHADGAAREIRYPLALAGHAFATMCKQWVRSKRFSRRSLLDAIARAVSERAAAGKLQAGGMAQHAKRSRHLAAIEYAD